MVFNNMRSANSAASTSVLQRYMTESRSLFNSLVLVLPLFVLYQIGILATGGIRNGVDFVTRGLMSLVGGQMLWYVAIQVAVLVGFVGALFSMRKDNQFEPRYYPWILLESTVYAFLFGGTVNLMMHSLGLDVLLLIPDSIAGFFHSNTDAVQAAAQEGVALAKNGSAQQGPFVGLVMSAGAGLYEELVFRLFMMGGIFWAMQRLGQQKTWLAAFVAVVVSSLIFSGIHHIGSLGDDWDMGVFLFRFFAGVLLAVIFHLRGFAVAAYTHAIYDMLILVFGFGS